MGIKEADQFFQQHIADDPTLNLPTEYVPGTYAQAPAPTKVSDNWYDPNRLAATGVRIASGIAPEAIIAAGARFAPATKGASIPISLLLHAGLRALSGKYGEKAARAIEGAPEDASQENIQALLNVVPIPGFRSLKPAARIAAHTATGAGLSGIGAAASEYDATGDINPENVMASALLGAGISGGVGVALNRFAKRGVPPEVAELGERGVVGRWGGETPTPTGKGAPDIIIPDIPAKKGATIKELLKADARLEKASAEAPRPGDPIGSAVGEGEAERAARLLQRQGTPDILATTRDTTILEPTAGLGARAQQPVLGGARVPEALAETPMDIAVNPVALAQETQGNALRKSLQPFASDEVIPRGKVPTGWDAITQGKASLGDEDVGLGVPATDIPSGAMRLDVNTDVPLISDALLPSRGMQIAPDEVAPRVRTKPSAIPLPSKTARFEPKTVNDMLLLPEKSSAGRMSAQRFVEKVASGDLDPSHVSLVDLMGHAFSLGEVGAVGKLSDAQQISGLASRQARKLARNEILRRVEQRMADGLDEAAALDAEGLSHTMYRALLNAADTPGLTDAAGNPIKDAPYIAGVAGSLQPELYNSAMRVVEKTPIIGALRDPVSKPVAGQLVRNAAVVDARNTITKDVARATNTPTVKVGGVDYAIRDIGKTPVEGFSTKDPLLVAGEMANSANPMHPVVRAYTDPLFDMRDNRHLAQQTGEAVVTELAQRAKIRVGSSLDVSLRKVLEGSNTVLDTEVLRRAGISDQMVQAVRANVREIYDFYLNKMNEARALRGLDPIPRRDNYFTHMNELQAFDQIVGGLLTDSTKKINEFVSAKMPMFGAALARGLPETPIANALTRMEQAGKIGERTVRLARKVIGVEPPGVFDGLKLYIDRVEDVLARSHAADTLAPLVQQLPDGSNVQKYWNGVVNKTLRGALYAEEKKYAPVVRPLQSLSNMTSSAIASFSVRIGLLQLASVPQTYAALTHNATPIQAARDFLRGTMLLRTPAVQDAIATVTRKNPLLDVNVFHRTSAEKFTRYANWLSNTVDGYVFQHAYATGLAQAERLGYEGKQAARYAENIASRAQGSEVRELRPPIFQHSIGRLGGAFQYFAQNMYNLGVRWSKELGGDTKQLQYLTTFVTAQYVANVMTQTFTGISPNWDSEKSIAANVAESLPWLRYLQSDGNPLISASKKTYRWLTDTPDQYGRPTTALDVGAAFVPGGVQAQRTLKGLADVRKGYHGTPGDPQYLVRGTDSVKALLYGPTNTTEGQKYYQRKAKEKKMRDMMKQ